MLQLRTEELTPGVRAKSPLLLRGKPGARRSDRTGRNGHKAPRRIEPTIAIIGKATDRNVTASNCLPPLSTVSDGQPKNGHDEKGRFTKGNTAATGNPFARRMAKLRSTLLDAVSEDDFQAIVGAMVRKAKDGDTATAKLLFVYLIGRPPEPLTPTGWTWKRIDQLVPERTQRVAHLRLPGATLLSSM
jgi:hypothetical protein